jgi:hypothetical protein
MKDQRKAALLKGWDSLAPKEQARLFEYFEFMVEKGKPGYQAKVNAEDEAYRVQLAKVHDLKSRLESVCMEVRKVLFAFLPAGEAQNFQVTQELLIFLSFAAEYKPFYLFEDNGAVFHLAENTIRKVTRRLANLEKVQG